jgi:hypothetical protein
MLLRQTENVFWTDKVLCTWIGIFHMYDTVIFHICLANLCPLGSSPFNKYFNNPRFERSDQVEVSKVWAYLKF